MQIILASGSPRRHELLSQAGVNFDVMSADIDEQVDASETPKNYLKRMVAQKALATMDKLNQCGFQLNVGRQTIDFEAPLLIVTADTIGILPDGQSILVKPRDKADAFTMWQQMSDTTHQVCTAVQATLLIHNPVAADLTHSADVNLNNRPISDQQNTALQYTDSPSALRVAWQQQIIECTEVNFVPLTSEQMERYWQSGEPLDKAGGYAIQAGAAAWVASIHGSYTNVVGLPLAQTLALIDEAEKIARNILNA